MFRFFIFSKLLRYCSWKIRDSLGILIIVGGSSEFSEPPHTTRKKSCQVLATFFCWYSVGGSSEISEPPHTTEKEGCHFWRPFFIEILSVVPPRIRDSILLKAQATNLVWRLLEMPIAPLALWRTPTYLSFFVKITSRIFAVAVLRENIFWSSCPITTAYLQPS